MERGEEKGGKKREGEEKGGKKREEKELMTENARKGYIHCVCTSPILLTHIRVHVHIIPIPHSSVVPWNGNETGSSSFCPWNETCHKRAVHT